MALATPLTVTIDGTAYPLERTYVLGSRSEYQDASGLVKAIVSHTYKGSRVSRLFRVEQRILQPSGLYATVSFHTVNDYDRNMITATQAKNLEVGVSTLKAATSYAVATKVLGGES